MFRFVTIVTICAATCGPAGASTPTQGFRLGAQRCDLLAVPASSVLAGRAPCPGVRPGALVQTPKGYCTLNFLFLGSDGNRYIATAGHCVLGASEFETNAGEKSWRYGRGPFARDANGKTFGYFTYAILQEPKDFALIRIARGVASNPSMCVFGGPTGITTSTHGPALLHHYGNGTGIGDLLPARSEAATDMSSPDHVYANGVIAPGDSGSPVIDDNGKAVGVIVTLGAHSGDGLTDDGVMGITRLAPQLARALRVLRLRSLRLLTARLA